MSPATLDGLLADSAARVPDRIAVEEPSGRQLTYAGLRERSGALAGRLTRWGIGPGERVAFCLGKSLESVVSIWGILRSGAAYVPLDPLAPLERNLGILRDAEVRALVTDAPRAEAWGSGLAGNGVRLVAVADAAPAWPAESVTWSRLADEVAPSDPPEPDPDRLAYVLYTSGSTGKPKGVMLTHENALSFVRWSAETLPVSGVDRFSSHAPFYFDLSVFDLFVPALLGGTVVLVPDDVGKDPKRLASLVEASRLTVWYSTPSVLTLLVESGELAARDCAALRVVLFAGEPFPLSPYRRLREAWPHPVYFNLYGPTETNVCTFYRVPNEAPGERAEPFPIGIPCSHCGAIVVDEALRPVGEGEIGELCIAGPSVFRGYWKAPERESGVFFENAEGTRWYRTGDLVRRAADGNLLFHGRRDRMVKRRGYRIELGEIEAALQRHPHVLQAAAVATPDPAGGVRISAFVAAKPGRRPSVIEVKRHLAEAIPVYMSPDRILFLEALPKTSTDKVDYRRLQASVPPAGGVPGSA